MIIELQQVMEQLKACLQIAYPGMHGLGDWEPARLICEGDYNFDDVNTNQTDVNNE